MLCASLLITEVLDAVFVNLNNTNRDTFTGGLTTTVTIICDFLYIL